MPPPTDYKCMASPRGKSCQLLILHSGEICNLVSPTSPNWDAKFENVSQFSPNPFFNQSLVFLSTGFFRFSAAVLLLWHIAFVYRNLLIQRHMESDIVGGTGFRELVSYTRKQNGGSGTESRSCSRLREKSKETNLTALCCFESGNGRAAFRLSHRHGQGSPPQSDSVSALLWGRQYILKGRNWCT